MEHWWMILLSPSITQTDVDFSPTSRPTHTRPRTGSASATARYASNSGFVIVLAMGFSFLDSIVLPAIRRGPQLTHNRFQGRHVSNRRCAAGCPEDSRHGSWSAGRVGQDVNIEVPVEQLGDRQQRFVREGIWLGIVVACALLAAVKPALSSITAAALYIPIVCVAFWKLGEKAGWFVAFLIGLTTGLSASGPAPINLAVHVLVFALAGWVGSRVLRISTGPGNHAGNDPLTGALTREAFDDALKQAVEPTQGSRSLVLLAVVDLDDLGAINGRFGRREGDRVLMAFAQQARRSLGSTGIFGRIGGDRFGFLVAVNSHDKGERFAIGLQTALSFVLARRTNMVTCSMGALLISPQNRRSVVSLMDSVEQLVITAKRSGKNAVELEWNGLHSLRLVPRYSSVATRGEQ